MAYSKEAERQNQALDDILSGRETEKRIMVGYEGEKQKQGDIIPKMTELMQGVRMPMFCPECDVIMKKRLDDKMWRLYGHCFDCQIKIENRLRIEGKFEEWAEEKIRKNKISFIKDQIQAIKEWRDMKSPVFYNQVGVNYPEIEKEEWAGASPEIKKMAEEALEEYNKVLTELEDGE